MSLFIQIGSRLNGGGAGFSVEGSVSKETVCCVGEGGTYELHNKNSIK